MVAAAHWLQVGRLAVILNSTAYAHNLFPCKHAESLQAAMAEGGRTEEQRCARCEALKRQLADMDSHPPLYTHCTHTAQAAMAEGGRTEDQRRALREALKRQLADMDALSRAAEGERREQEELMARIKAMEGKVGCSLCLRCVWLWGRQGEQREQEELMARIKEMEGKVRKLNATHACTRECMHAQHRRARE